MDIYEIFNELRYHHEDEVVEKAGCLKSMYQSRLLKFQDKRWNTLCIKGWNTKGVKPYC